MFNACRNLFAWCAVLVLVGCGKSSSTTPPTLPVKPGDDLQGISSQSLSAYDDDRIRLAVLAIHKDSGGVDAALVQAVTPYLIFDATKKDEALEVTGKLKENYRSPAAKEVLTLLEDMWKCPEEVISFKIRAGKEEIGFSKGPPISAADWEIVDLTRRAGNVAGSLGSDPEKAVELLNSAATTGASPRFVGYLESVKDSYQRNVDNKAKAARP